MPHEILDAEVKTRVTSQQRDALQAKADARHLKLSDILREAIREKLARDTEPEVVTFANASEEAEQLAMAKGGAR